MRQQLSIQYKKESTYKKSMFHVYRFCKSEIDSEECNLALENETAGKHILNQSKYNLLNSNKGIT